MARDQIAVMPPPEFVAPAAPATSVVAGLAIDWRWMAAAQRPITDQALNEPTDMSILDGRDDQKRVELIAERLKSWKSMKNT